MAAGFVNNSVYSKNLQSGEFSVTLGGTGTDNSTITFRENFEKVPRVNFSKKTAGVFSDMYLSDISLSGFKLNLVSSNLTGEVEFDYIAADMTYN